MKTVILLVTFMWLSFQSYSQYARSVYSDDSSAKRRSSLFSVNGETTILSIRESSNDTLRVMLMDIDENGETDNYRMYEYSPFDVSTAFALSGIGANSSGEVTICVLKQNTNTNDVHYITVNPATGVFSNDFSLNGLYKKGFTRTRAKGDSLITYVANYSTTGISRVAKSLSTSAVSTDLAASNTSFSGTLFQGSVACELVIDGSEEYIATKDLILKRSSANNYITSSYSGIITAPGLAIKSTGEMFLVNNFTGECTILDANLSIVNSGSIPELQGASSGLSELYALPNDDIRVWSYNGNTGRILDIGTNFTLTNNRRTRNLPQDQFRLNGKQFIVGYDFNNVSHVNEEGIPFQGNASNVTIIYDDLGPDLPEFIEYDQIMSSGNLDFHVNHVSRSFTDHSEGLAGFFFEQNGMNRSLIYAAASNIIGTTVNSTLLGTTNLYSPTQVTGPYCDPGVYTLEVMDKYNRGYYVTREMIETHLFEITTGNPNYEIPFGIREWPAHGDVSLGQAANLAGFIDQNGNGTYEPELGDYPAIYGDKCLLNMYHQHPNTPSSASIETHQYYFTFDCDSSETLENTVFIRTDNFNRGQTLFNTYEGDYVDFDIGNPFDDYAGTNVELGMTYGYNGDFNDETNSGALGFNDTIPAVGMVSLQGLKLDEDGIDNNNPIPTISTTPNGIGFTDGIVDNEYYTMESSFFYTSTSSTNPGDASQWYNTMQGLTPVGFPKELNGVEIRHDYFGTSDASFYSSFGVDHGNNYSETNGSNVPGDRRISSASGPSSFSITDTMVFLKAYVVGVDTVNLSPSNSLIKLFEHGQILRDAYAQNSIACGNSFDSYVSSSTLAVEEEKIEQILVYPNPAAQHIQFRGIAGSADLNIFDLNGRVVLSDQNVDDHTSIDISGLEKAIYLIQISDENGQQTIRMIKQ